MAALLCLKPYMQFHMIFFAGASEISNIPLNVMDLFKAFPLLRRRYPRVGAALPTA